MTELASSLASPEEPLCVKNKKRGSKVPVAVPRTCSSVPPTQSTEDMVACGCNPQAEDGWNVAVKKDTVTRMASQYTSCAGCCAAVGALIKRPLSELRLLNAVMTEDDEGNLRLRDVYRSDTGRLQQLLSTFPLASVISKVQPSGANLRCAVHRRPKAAAPGSAVKDSVDSTWDWEDAWDRLPQNLQLKVATIEIHTLETAVHNATAAHRFCSDCKHNVVTTLDILTEKTSVEDVENSEEFNPDIFKPFAGRIVPEVINNEVQKVLQCPVDDVEDMIAWFEDFDSQDYASSGQRHAATLEHGQREVRSIIGCQLLTQLRSAWQNHTAQMQTEQYLFCLVIHSIRTQIAALSGEDLTVDTSVGGLAIFDNSTGALGTSGGAGALATLSGAKATMALSSSATPQLTDGTDCDPTGANKKSKSKKKKERKAKARARKEQEQADGQEKAACTQEDEEAGELSEPDDAMEEVDAELLKEMEALKANLTKMKDDREQMRTNLKKNFENFMART